MQEFLGTLNDDYLRGGFLADTIVGYAGQDTLEGSRGHDVLLGGDDDDFLYGGTSIYSTDAGIIRMVSAGSDGNQSMGGSEFPSISADGRYTVFSSYSPNLVAGDDNNLEDVFVHDLQTGETRRVSVGNYGNQTTLPSFGDGGYQPSISADGRLVAFVSYSTDLVLGDTNGFTDVFVHDLQTGETRLVSITSEGHQGNEVSTSPSISADGRFIAFESLANLVEGDIPDAVRDIYVHDLHSGETRRISVAIDGSHGSKDSSLPAINADGRYVAFTSSAFNLVPGDTNSSHDIFVHDSHTGEIRRVSVASDGSEGNGSSQVASISADGRYVTFSSDASNLVQGDTNAATDIFVHDLLTGETRRISVASDGSEANGISYWHQISGDGRYVAFVSLATNLVAGDTNERPDTFIHDLVTGETRHISVVQAGYQGYNSHGMGMVDISYDGSYVAFGTGLTLVAEDAGYEDVYVVHTGFGDGTVEWAPQGLKDGDDLLMGGAGNDLLDGGGGYNLAAYVDAIGGVTVDLSLSGPQATGSSGTDTLLNIDNLYGSYHDDHLSGNDRRNVLFGLSGNDLIKGGAEADLIFGEEGNDTLLGEAGDDFFLGGPGDDYLDGGAGMNGVNYFGNDAAITVDLSSFSVQSTGIEGNDFIVNVALVSATIFADVLIGDTNDNLFGGQAGADDLIGADGNDTLLGHSGADTLDGGSGDDFLHGGDDIDWADYRYAASGVTVNLALTSRQATGGAGADTLQDIENILGSAFDDYLSSNTGNNILDGGAGNDLLESGAGHDLLLGGTGNDSLYGGAGNDTLFAGPGDDFLDGGTGSDLADYSDSTAGVTLDLGNALAQNTGSAGFDTIVNILRVAGSVFGDLLVGNEEANTIDGYSGDDTLLGGAGDDVLRGGAGTDLLDGGSGFDAASYLDAYSEITVNLLLSGPQNTGGAGIDTLLSIEHIEGGHFDDHLSGDSGANHLHGFNGNDTLLGSMGNDSLIGGAGDDLLDGGEGIDTAAYTFINSGMTVDLSISGPQATLGAGTDTLLNIENLIGGSRNDHLSGNSGDNELRGGGGHDSLYGGAGNDSLWGENGIDALFGGDGNDLLEGGLTSDIIDGGPGTDTSVYMDNAEHYQLRWNENYWYISSSQELDGFDRLYDIEYVRFADKTVDISSTPHASYASIPDALWHFFIVAFGGAPGVFYMDQMSRLYNKGNSVQDLLNIFVTKPQYLERYPAELSQEEFAVLFVNNVVQDTVLQPYKDLAVQDILNQFANGKTLAEVIYTSIGKMARLGEGNQIWGNTARLFNKQILVAKYYTDNMSQSTTDTGTLRDVLAAVRHDSVLTTEYSNVPIEFIGLALLSGEGV